MKNNDSPPGNYRELEKTAYVWYYSSLKLAWSPELDLIWTALAPVRLTAQKLFSCKYIVLQFDYQENRT